MKNSLRVKGGHARGNACMGGSCSGVDVIVRGAVVGVQGYPYMSSMGLLTLIVVE